MEGDSALEINGGQIRLILLDKGKSFFTIIKRELSLPNTVGRSQRAFQISSSNSRKNKADSNLNPPY